MSAAPKRGQSLRPFSRPRLYEQLVERLLDHISAEGLQPGDRLPPERELAAQLAVSRASVSQALIALEVQGVIDVRHGDGAVILDVPPRQQVLAALDARRNQLREVIEAREALEVQLAALAAQRRTEHDLAAIDAALDDMAREVARGGRGVSGDERFHAAVTAAAHSGLLADLMVKISELVRESRIESLSQPGRPEQSLAGHRKVADAIRSGDAAAAAAAMGAHIAAVSDVALLRKS
ncbi:FadR/GntR family transcriptional regulator [Pseudonocardia xinjiangensis]|uniref:FadR family transcriptional regulator n=1 Tax=Pseudonocardia xinjiangensis TaxID=75289 RepID=A0ABX1RCZ8_9PSEU|nr:FadR/GntR family transcriptional regulator [Pseudonocardia xinjiangensis]NMH77021.1 FadR family transcriptional regulator [Pseudonocardia xinjiangensis]